jgi:hypothetical protein
LINAGFGIPISVPKKWVVDCAYTGKGLSALKYSDYNGFRGGFNILKLLNHKSVSQSVSKGMRQDGTAHFSRHPAVCSWDFSHGALKKRVLSGTR